MTISSEAIIGVKTVSRLQSFTLRHENICFPPENDDFVNDNAVCRIDCLYRVCQPFISDNYLLFFLYYKNYFRIFKVVCLFVRLYFVSCYL